MKRRPRMKRPARATRMAAYLRRAVRKRKKATPTPAPRDFLAPR
jgi:hypothetical protein